MPLSNPTTPAGSEGDQVMPLLDSVKIKTNKRGRPQGYDSKDKGAALRRRSIRPQCPKGVWKRKKNKGRPIKISVPGFQQERCFPWFQKNIVVLLSDEK